MCVHIISMCVGTLQEATVCQTLRRSSLKPSGESHSPTFSGKWATITVPTFGQPRALRTMFQQSSCASNKPRGPMWSNVVLDDTVKHVKSRTSDGDQLILPKPLLMLDSVKVVCPRFSPLRPRRQICHFSCWFCVHHFSLGDIENISDSNMRTAKNST